MRKVRVRAVISHPVADGRFLFVKHQHDSSLWALAGGGLEDNETLQQGLERELVEELGIRPVIGRLLYVQQLFLADHESLKFFFAVTNGSDYLHIDLHSTTRGVHELAAAEFIDPAVMPVLPEFLAGLQRDVHGKTLPQVHARHAAV